MTLTITSSNQKFIADAMLGRLAKKLRLLGLDCIYHSDIEDSNLLNIAETEKRIILTKDKQLSITAEKCQIPFVYVTSDDQIEQLFQISSCIELNLKIDSNTARCSVCNGMLEKTKKSLISSKVPDGVLEINNDFWICSGCKKIYWEGTHIKNLQKFLGSVHERFD